MNRDSPLLLELGDWKVYLFAEIPNAKLYLSKFKDHFHDFVTYNIHPSLNVGWMLIVRSSSLGSLDTLVWWPPYDQMTGMVFPKHLSMVYQRFSSPKSQLHLENIQHAPPFRMFLSDLRISESDRHFINNNQQTTYPTIFLILDESAEFSHLHIFGAALSLSTQWHLKRGSICLHSAAVTRRNDGFLFLGASEAGKTTVSQLSTEIGYPALGDDLNFIINDQDGIYRLAASPSPNISPVGYSRFRPPLKGIFTLVKDGYDALNPLQPIQLSRALFKQFYQETPHVRKFSDEFINLGFQICCDIARKIPGYELHFRKSHDFWKLIDEQFPD